MKLIFPRKYDSAIGKIDFSEIKMTKATNENDIIIEISDDDFQLFMVIINEAITSRGLDNQNEVNELGRQLYEVYDIALSQKKELNRP